MDFLTKPYVPRRSQMAQGSGKVINADTGTGLCTVRDAAMDARVSEFQVVKSKGTTVSSWHCRAAVRSSDGQPVFSPVKFEGLNS